MDTKLDLERKWKLVETINQFAEGEGWNLAVCGDGMMVIQTDEDAETPQHDAFSFVEAKADTGSLLHIIAHGLHGMILTDDRADDWSKVESDYDC